jgi:hypothetical protein
MSMPFTREQFLDVFAAYNTSLWFIAIALWVVTAFAIVLLLRGGGGTLFINVVMLVHWAWSGLAYHAAFFSKINPAALLFSSLFVTEAALLAWYGVVQERLQFSVRRSFRHVVSWGLVGYGMLYPTLVWAEGLTFPRMPTFGVPCPTTIITIGLLLASKSNVPKVVTLIPILWAFIGGSGAFLLGLRADFVLLGAGIVLAAVQLGPPRKGPSKINTTSSCVDRPSKTSQLLFQ